MLAIELNQFEYDSLAQLIFKNQLGDFINECTRENGQYILRISGDDADDIRDICLDELEYAGHDVNYDVTPEGLILESLVDKFFTG